MTLVELQAEGAAMGQETEALKARLPPLREGVQHCRSGQAASRQGP